MANMPFTDHPAEQFRDDVATPASKQYSWASRHENAINSSPSTGSIETTNSQKQINHASPNASSPRTSKERDNHLQIPPDTGHVHSTHSSVQSTPALTAQSGEPDVASTSTANAPSKDKARVRSSCIVDDSLEDESLDIPESGGFFLPVEYLQRIRRSQDLRNQTVESWDTMEYQRRVYVDRLHHVVKASRDMAQLGEQILLQMNNSGAMHSAQQSELQSAWVLLKAISSAIEQQANVMTQSNVKLGDLTSKAAKNESKLSSWEGKFLETVVNDPDAQTVVTPDDYSAASQHYGGTVSARSGTSNMTDPLEHAYYDAIGDVTLAREHLYNFETEHSQALYTRQDLRESGQEPELADNEFWDQYFEERRKYVDEYVIGKDQVERLYKECEEAGMRVNAPNLPPLDSRVLDQLHSGQTISTPSPPQSEGKASESNLRKKIEGDRMAMRNEHDRRNTHVANRLRVALWSGETLASDPESGLQNMAPSIKVDTLDEVEDGDVDLSKFAGERASRRYSESRVIQPLPQKAQSLFVPTIRSHSTSSLTRNKSEPAD